MNRRALLASIIASLARPLVRPILRTQGPRLWIALSCKGER